MLTGSALTRALVIVVLAAGLAALWQVLMPRPSGPHLSEPPKRAKPEAPAPAPADDAAPVRSVYPGGRPPDAPPPRPPSAPAAPLPSPAPTPAPQAALPAEPPVFAPPAPGEPSADPAERVPPGGVVDLNTASLGELNGLRGGGMIGRAIIAGRPYNAPGDLLSKRILSRGTYERIKDQVTVR
ncbi:hypothetical protein OPKNFCMD_5358 [Methylobacterium crusticola]|uniref:Helix-hairpin-helix domain-containing protein n=1 Tax=Methylobacterium crusticola TaxID=1697972 RepID=A0ABQ4R578_9HYPH|nr:helix-hairpin-helix domain-containing protein [Methylobacterium crusticola]GJD52592.1 hypothetical protein OPKNFCMD_5358 [Methylobacterium crusticola]